MPVQNWDPIVAEVLAEMVSLRERNASGDRTGAAIRTIAKRRGKSFEFVEALVEPALAFRVAF